MKLAQYLALGKSIANVSLESRYKWNPSAAVPHFGSGRVSVVRDERDVLESTSLPVLEESPPRCEAVLPVQITIAKSDDNGSAALAGNTSESITEMPQTLNDPLTAAEAVSPVNTKQPSRSQRRPAGVGTWILGRRVRIKDPVALAAKREMALKSVRPVRNDLSETDYVVVPQGMQLAAAGVRGKDSLWQRCMKWIFE